MAPFEELSTTIDAVVPPFHPAMVPSSLTKMNLAGAGVLPGKEKSEVPLKTTPVGAEGSLPPGGAGIVTTTTWFLVPAPLERVESPAWLSDTHQGLAALRVKPQGLMSCVARG